LILTVGGGIPVAIGGIQSGNHNDLYWVIPQFSDMLKSLNRCRIVVQNSILNADKGFDSKNLRRACRRKSIKLNIKETIRNRKYPEREKKRFFDNEIYKNSLSMNYFLLG